MMRSLGAAAAVLLLASLPGCGDRDRADMAATADTAATRVGETMQDATQDATGAVDAPRTTAFEDRTDFVQSVRNELAQIDQQIEQLASQAKSEGGAVSDRALANLRAARRAVNQNLARVDQATEENWEEIHRGVEEAMEHLDEAVEMAQPK